MMPLVLFQSRCPAINHGPKLLLREPSIVDAHNVRLCCLSLFTDRLARYKSYIDNYFLLVQSGSAIDFRALERLLLYRHRSLLGSAASFNSVSTPLNL